MERQPPSDESRAISLCELQFVSPAQADQFQKGWETLEARFNRRELGPV